MELLKDVSENNGFYWCYIKGYPPDTDVLELVRSKNGRLVEINGFDDLFKEIADITGFSVEKLVESFDKRKDDLVKRITEFNKNYSRKPLIDYAEELKKEKYSENLTAVDYFVLGAISYENGDFTAAEESFRNVIELDPLYIEAYMNLGLVLFRDVKRWTEAAENFKKAIELNPKYSSAYNNLGVLLLRLGKVDEAKTAFETSAKFDEKNGNPLVALAGIYKREGNLEMSKKYAEKAEELVTDDDYANQACLSAILDEKDKALKYLKLAVEENSIYKFWAETDPDFDSLRNNEQFREIIGA
jgi:tetratricopeptide (TPR) repeat protein